MIGLRREDKSAWEARVPLVPEDVRGLVQQEGVQIQVQRATRRAFADAAYQAAGAEVVESLAACPVIVGVKEIPPELFEPGKTYIYFSHTIKGQAANMPALRRLMELGCTLLDYERIADVHGRRLVFFGHFAGLAGMVDTLWTLGRRLQHEGLDSPFARVQPAHGYREMVRVREAMQEVGAEIRTRGLPPEICPFVCGFAGYGNVSRGAQEVFDLLPTREVTPKDLPTLPADPHVCYKVVFREEHLVHRVHGTGPFDVQHYFHNPEAYAADFLRHAPYLTVLMNCIYWEPQYPRLLSREDFVQLRTMTPAARLRVIGDITCDVDGSLACTTHTTTPDDPVYVYDAHTGQTASGVAGDGSVVLAVDFLPCELPVDSSRHFSAAVRPFIPALDRADFGQPLERCGLPPEMQRAVIVQRGELTGSFEYLAEALKL